MKKLILVGLMSSQFLSAVLVLTAGTVAAQQTPPAGATAQVKDASGRLVANAEFREGHGEVVITLSFASPPALTGSHGLRIQQVGRCDPPDFLSAGGGFNPLGKQHGRQNPNGPQVGDLPNVNFATGLTSYNTSATGATLGPGPTSLLGPNGTALVIYANEDDQLTDPDGKAGARVACGVITAGSSLPGAGLFQQSGGLTSPPVLIVGAIGLGLIGFGLGLRRRKGVIRTG